MADPIDLIAAEISDCWQRIEDCHRAISYLRKKIRELSFQAVETEDGEIFSYDDMGIACTSLSNRPEDKVL
jgi:hypothetical protein